MSAEPVPRRVALVVHPTRPVERARATLAQWADEHGIEVVQLAIDGDRHRDMAAPGTLEDGDIVVALGGDGTVLAALREAAPRGAPVLGVACGSLGALSAVTADRLAGALERLRAGDWSARSLPALSVASPEAQTAWAANDFVVVRRGPGQLLADVTVDDELYARIAGDGLVVATALGSSAYSMAAGGPVLAGGTAAFVCTPLAMHGGSAPPLVVPADATVGVEVHPGYAGFDVEIDGHGAERQALSYRLALHTAKLTLVAFGAPGRGLSGLRERRLIADSPRVLIRDAREGR